MTARETWVLYDDNGNPKSYGKSEREAWKNYATDISDVWLDSFIRIPDAVWLDSFIRISDADGWRCLRVDAAEIANLRAERESLLALLKAARDTPHEKGSALCIAVCVTCEGIETP